MPLTGSRPIQSFLGSFTCIGFLTALLLTLLFNTTVIAQVTTSITSSGLGTTVTQNGAVYDITGGTRPANGPNLFHSFGDFSVGVGTTARFRAANPDSTVGNILSRVTGGNPSSIFGTVDSATYYPNANLFVLNPAGIVFGPTATLNVGGSVHFSTADYIRLSDQVLFNAVPDPTADALLTASPFAAFGFFGSNTGAISVQGSQLTVPNGKDISLTSHSLTIQGGTLENGYPQPARLSAPGGRVGLAALSGPGEIEQTSFIPRTNSLGEFPVDATSVRLAGNSFIDVTDTGRVSIRGGQFVVDVQKALLTTQSPGSPAMPDHVALEGNQSFIRNAMFAGPGIEATVEAQSIKLTDGAQIMSRAEGLGPAGGISLTARTVEVNGASIDSIIEPFDFVFEELRGPSLTLNVGNLRVRNGGSIAAASSDIFGMGSPIVSGTVTITASDTVTVEGISAAGSSSKIESLTSSGAVGDIIINTSKLVVTQSGRISSEAQPGQAGQILVTATESAKITDGGKIRMNTSDLGGGLIDLFSPSILLDQAIVQTFTVGTGDAATVHLHGGNITIAGGQINSQSTEGLGRGGDVTLSATGPISISGQFAGNQIDPAGPAGIFSTTAVQGAPGGNISLTSGQTISITNGASVSASSTGTGNAGNIELHAAGNFQSNGGIVRTTASQAQGGDILITAGQDIVLTNGSSTSASSSGPGNAGNITALAGDDFVMQNSSITTQAAQASGGNIKIGAADQIQIRNSLISASVQGGGGSGGNISIDPRAVFLTNSRILANAVDGNGGNITITTPFFLADQSSVISASSQFGLDGTVTIQSPTSNLAGTVASLPSSMRQTQALQTGRCAALAHSQSSSFLIAGRDTIPAEPGGWLPSPFAYAGADADPLAKALPPVPSLTAMAEETISLRRLNPAGFLTQRFAEDGSTGCRT